MKRSQINSHQFEEKCKKVVAEVRQGSLISLDETQAAEQILGKKLDWEEVENSRVTIGGYFQCLYQVSLGEREANIAESAITNYRQQFDV